MKILGAEKKKRWKERENVINIDRKTKIDIL